MSLFPVVLNDGGELPKDDIFYLIAKNGIFLRKKMGLVDSLAPVKQISILEPATAEASMNISKIPEKTFAHIVGLFKQIYQMYSAECIVIFHYNEKSKKWKLEVPAQKVSGGAANYTGAKSFQGYTRIGTIHSHASMSAFHSGTDVGDEETFDGLHMTLGNMNSDGFSMVACVALNGHRVTVNGEDYVEGIARVGGTPKPAKPQIMKYQVNGKWYERTLAAPAAHRGSARYDINHKLQLTYPKSWLSQVTGTKWGGYGTGYDTNYPNASRSGTPGGGYWINTWKGGKMVREWKPYTQGYNNRGAGAGQHVGGGYRGRNHGEYHGQMGFDLYSDAESSWENASAGVPTLNPEDYDINPCEECVFSHYNNDIQEEEFFKKVLEMDEDELADLGLRTMSLEETEEHEVKKAAEAEEELHMEVVEASVGETTLSGNIICGVDVDGTVNMPARDNHGNVIPGTCIK